MPEHQLRTRACQDPGRRCLLHARRQVGHRPAQHQGQVGDREPAAEQCGGAQHLCRLGGHRAEPVGQYRGQRDRELLFGQGELGSGSYLQCLLTHQGVDQFSYVQRVAGRLSRQPPECVSGRCSDHRRHQGGHIRLGQRPQCEHRGAAAHDGRAHLLHLLPARRRPAGGYQQQPQLADRGGQLVPDHQRRVIGPLQVIEDQHRGSGRAQLVCQRQQHLYAGRLIALTEQPRPPTAQQVGRLRPARIR